MKEINIVDYMYNYFLFDWDGCIVDTLPITLAAYKKAFNYVHIEVSDKEIVDKVFGDWEGPRKLGVTDLDEFNRVYLGDVYRNYITANLHADAKKVLQAFKKKGKHLALVTVHRREIAEPLIRKYDLANLFEAMLFVEDVKEHKPNPEMVHAAIRRINGKHEESIIIGDSDDDIVSGSNAQIDAALFYPPENESFYSLDDLRKYNPKYIFRGFKEMLETFN